jgi:hypothetical protein
MSFRLTNVVLVGKNGHWRFGLFGGSDPGSGVGISDRECFLITVAAS